MLQIARLSPKQLGDSARLVSKFLHSQLNPDGGFRDRSGASDLYYTVFGLEGLIALSEKLPDTTLVYLQGFGNGDTLDFVHLCCLIRCWADLGKVAPVAPGRLFEQLTSNAYNCFLACAAYQDLRLPIPEPQRVADFIETMRADDGSYSNLPRQPIGLTPPTAAAVTLLRQLDAAPTEPRPMGAGTLADWLLARHHAGGGFHATPFAPIPDLLSTATALHALAGMKVPIDTIQESCLDFIDSLWTNSGAFYGNWMDDTQDCEYTYYGLLSLGHLSL